MKSIIVPLLLFGIMGCAQKNKLQEMKSISSKLMKYLSEHDSVSISKMFNDNNYFENRKDDISNDCLLFSSLIVKYGMPKTDKFIKSIGLNDENVLSVNLITKPDSLFNLKNCQLVIFFYPDEYYNSKNKFLDYAIYKEPLHAKKKEIIIAPTLKIRN
jgi:hypothetical protein